MKSYFYPLIFLILIHIAHFKMQGNYEKKRIMQQYPTSLQNQENTIKSVEIIQNNSNNETTSILGNTCPCLNNGKCFTPNNIFPKNSKSTNNTYCKCQRNFIGALCQQSSIQLPVQSDIYQLIRTTKYKYFYYQPLLQNAYEFNFHICFSQTDQQLINTNMTNLDQIQKSITFFFTLQNINGTIELNQTQNQPQTIVLNRDQCKHIYADYTTFSYTQTSQIQKLILAVKLGDRLYDPNDMTIYTNADGPDKKKNNLKYQLDNTVVNNSSEKLKYHINSSHSNKKYTLQYLQKALSTNTTRLVYIDFNISPFTIEQVFQKILFSLVTIAAFVIIAFLIYILRTKVLGLSLAQTFNSGQRMINDIKHLDKFMPPESFRQYNTANTNIEIGDDDDQPQCAICLIAFGEGEQVRRTPCDHVFHKQCIDSWCLQNLTCPVCRKSLTLKNLKQLDQPSLLQIRTNSDSND